MARGFRAPTLGGWIRQERGNEVAGGWAGREEKRREEKKKKKKETAGENRELVRLERFVKIPRTTYKLHRIVGRSRTGAKSFSFFPLSLLACELSRARLTGRKIGIRAPREIQFAGNALRGASRKPVESDKLVIEQRIFLSFSGKWLGRPTRRDPIVRARGSDIVFDI